MPFSLIPRHMAEHLYDLTPEVLRERGISFLMLDFDNTIVPYTTNEPTAPMNRWLSEILASEIGICVVSNSKRDRVVKFCSARGIPCITHSKKPFRRGICQCLERFRPDPVHTALVGDQIYTDVLGANCAGIQSVVVRPIRLHNIWLKLRHVAELPFLAIGRCSADQIPENEN